MVPTGHKRVNSKVCRVFSERCRPMEKNVSLLSVHWQTEGSAIISRKWYFVLLVAVAIAISCFVGGHDGPDILRVSY